MKRKRIRAIVYAVLVAAVIIAGAVYLIPVVQEHNDNVAMGLEWADHLQKHPAFSAQPTGYPVEVKFEYASEADDSLRKLRETFDLDSIAGRGPETERIINLTRWVYQLTGHANNPEFPKRINAFTLIHLATVEHMTINCYLKTVILNEVLLAMGFSSRQTHLLPHSREEEESHYITSVYSKTLGKWILMDPDFGVYMTDEPGNILGVAEVRRRLISGESFIVNELNPARSIFVRIWENVIEWAEGADYPWYLSKNIFKIQCPQVSMFDQRSQPDQVYFELIPDGYREELLQASRITDRGRTIISINDEDLFWQEPFGQSE